MSLDQFLEVEELKKLYELIAEEWAKMNPSFSDIEGYEIFLKKIIAAVDEKVHYPDIVQNAREMAGMMIGVNYIRNVIQTKHPQGSTYNGVLVDWENRVIVIPWDTVLDFAQGIQIGEKQEE